MYREGLGGGNWRRLREGGRQRGKERMEGDGCSYLSACHQALMCRVQGASEGGGERDGLLLLIIGLPLVFDKQGRERKKVGERSCCCLPANHWAAVRERIGIVGGYLG